MPNVNDTEMKGASATANWRANDDWSVQVRARQARVRHRDQHRLRHHAGARSSTCSAFYSDEQVSNELQANYDAGGRARGVMGLYAFDGEAGGQVLNNFLNLPFGDTQGEVYTESVAFYADWTFDLTDTLKLDVGARYTDEDKHARGAQPRLHATARSPRRSRTVADFDKTINFKNISPKVSLDYADHAGHHGLRPGLARLQVGRLQHPRPGHRGAALGRAVRRRAGRQLRDRQQDGASSTRRLFLNLAAFHNKYEDIQLSVFTAFDSNGDGVDDAFFGDFTNAGTGTVKASRSSTSGCRRSTG